MDFTLIWGIINYGIQISQSTFHLYGFSDADWQGSPDTRRSTSGYCMLIDLIAYLEVPINQPTGLVQC